jgi:hypothetical protein
MSVYRVHFVDHGDDLYDVVELEMHDDEAAIEQAHRIHLQSVAASRCGRVTDSFTSIGIEPAICAGAPFNRRLAGALAVQLALWDLLLRLDPGRPSAVG